MDRNAETPTPETQTEERRAGDRRVAQDASYTGPERRRKDRRARD